LYAVGRAFTEAYYKKFNRQPQELYKMYGENSSYTHGWEGNEGDETFLGLEEIKRKLSSTDLGQVKVLSVISAQENSAGVIVVVTGSWEPSNQVGKVVSRRFMETFFLVRGSKGKTYYIQNDIVYILQNNAPVYSEVRQAQPPSIESENPPAEPKKESEPAKPHTSPALASHHDTPLESQQQNYLTNDEQPDVKKAEKVEEKPSPAQSSSVQPTPVQNPPEAVPAPSPNPPAPNAGVKTYAGAFRQGQAQGQAQPQSQQQSQPPQQPQLSHMGNSSGPRPRYPDDCRIFVRWPAEVREDQLIDAFQKFGQIVDKSFNRLKGFVILTGSTPEFVTRACREPVQVGNATLRAEPKMMSRGGPPRGGRGRGRR